MKLKDIMTSQVEVISPDSSILEAAQKMDRLDVGSIPVCDGNKVQGLITDRDITVKVTAKGQDPQSVMVRDVMSTPIIYAFEDADIDEAATLMESNQVRRLVVLNREKKMVGIVALGDLATKSDPDIAGEALEAISEPSEPNVA